MIDNKTLSISISNMTIVYKMDYTIESKDFEWMKDKGVGKVEAYKFDFILDVRPFAN